MFSKIMVIPSQVTTGRIELRPYYVQMTTLVFFLERVCAVIIACVCVRVHACVHACVLARVCVRVCMQRPMQP